MEEPCPHPAGLRDARLVHSCHLCPLRLRSAQGPAHGTATLLASGNHLKSTDALYGQVPGPLLLR